MRRHRSLDREQRRQLVVLQDDLAVGIDDEADVEETILPVLMARLGLRHDEDVPFARELADLVGLRARNVDAAGARVIGVIDVEHLVVEAHESAFRNGEQPHRDVEIGEPERRFGETLEVLDIVLDVLAPANAPERRDEPDGIIWLDHGPPLTTPSQAATAGRPASAIASSFW